MHENNEYNHNFIKAQLRELYNESEDTIWHIIARNGDVEIIQKRYFELDEREINFKNKAGLTPLDIAFAEGNIEMLKELIRCGAKNSTEEKLNFLVTAFRNNDSKMSVFIMQFLTITGESKYQNFGDYNSLHRACILNSLYGVKKSISEGVNLQSTFLYKDEESDLFYEKATALHIAIIKNNKSIVEELIKSGINLDATTRIHNGIEFLQSESGKKEFSALEISSGNVEIYNLISDKINEVSKAFYHSPKAYYAKRIDSAVCYEKFGGASRS
jgi:ankyrin repeat protein